MLGVEVQQQYVEVRQDEYMNWLSEIEYGSKRYPKKGEKSHHTLPCGEKPHTRDILFDLLTA